MWLLISGFEHHVQSLFMYNFWILVLLLATDNVENSAFSEDTQWYDEVQLLCKTKLLIN